MPRKFSDDEIRDAGRKAISEAGGDILRVTPGALRRLLGGGEPNANYGRMIALLSPEAKTEDVQPPASSETNALVTELATEIAALVAERARNALSAREAAITTSADRRVATATRDAERAQKDVAETRAAHDADVATLEAERDAARDELAGLRRALDAAEGQIAGLKSALTALGAKLPRKPRRTKGTAGPTANEIAAAT